jgi:hypothetical protein
MSCSLKQVKASSWAKQSQQRAHTQCHSTAERAQETTAEAHHRTVQEQNITAGGYWPIGYDNMIT